jgi:hypothetical protein
LQLIEKKKSFSLKKSIAEASTVGAPVSKELQ